MCLGTMLRLQQAGASLHFICVTDGSGGMVQAPEMTREEAAAVRDREMRDLASRVDASYVCLGEEDEYLYDSKDLRLRLIDALRACRADVVFTHHAPDYNLDHTTVNGLVRQCAMHLPFRQTHTPSPALETTPAVFLIEPMGSFEFEPTHFVDITSCIDRKRELALCHRSQDEAFRAAFGDDFGIDAWITRTSGNRGDQVGVPHAEAFRPMLSRGLVKPYSILP